MAHLPKALVAMLGEKTVNTEAAKLNKQYGKKAVTNFIDGSPECRAGVCRAGFAALKSAVTGHLNTADLSPGYGVGTGSG